MMYLKPWKEITPNLDYSIHQVALQNGRRNKDLPKISIN
jgi:hypothetical protein